MLRVTSKKHNRKGRQEIHGCERFVGLVAAAKDIGVHRIHLYLVLKGKRASASITSQVRTSPIPGKPGHLKVEVV